ncbi:DUF292-domain-containing protein [Decorospora gaudefroyi]|uniref:DUF292-domain-containing protein n=1 Tax=Decorospora gaudefroyi TaxID=184978 RepID=A0A6A5K4S4_9PLEO|nr:DUF292-domain-containing protein [Decorospora gaudefroyi]
MAPSVSLVNRLKVQLKLSISRLRMTQRKDSAIVKQQRREVAQRIENKKIQSAQILVEQMIRTDITTEAHEFLELYCELLLARSQLLESQVSSSSAPSATATTLDPALEEAVRSIIYAAPRTEVKELHTVRALLVEKFGKDVALASIEGTGVPKKLVDRLRVETPSEELVELYMSEIAKLYQVEYKSARSVGDDDDDDDDEPSAGIAEEAEKEKEVENALPAELDAKKDDEREELAKAKTPKKLGGPQSPLRVVPPSPSTDNVAPKLKLPGAVAAKKSEPTKKQVKKEDGLGKIPDVDELAKRFAQLKR